MQINDISAVVLNKSIEIHTKLGPGLLESVYQRILAYELRKYGLMVEAEVPIPVVWDGKKIEMSYRADLIVNDSVLLELKSVEATSKLHRKQTLTYVKLANLKLGLLINFGAEYIKDDFHRLIN